MAKFSKLKEIESKLKEKNSRGERNLSEAYSIIEDLDGRNTITILKTLGYKVKWRGLDPKNAKIEKQKV